MDNLNIFEANILLWIQENLRTGFGDSIMPYVSAINNAGIVSMLTVAVFLFWRRYRSVGVTAFCSLLSEFIMVNILLKPIVERTRPYFVNELLVPLGKIPGDFSFPSGHTGSAFAVAVTLLLCLPKKYGIPAMIVAILISFSRLYNVMHYPTDVLASMLIGTLTAYMAYKIVFPWANRLMQKEKTEE